jgi:lipoprotein-anchoring transpeptidase ErfK/SrfK
MFSPRRIALYAILFFGLIYGFFHLALPKASYFYQITPVPTIATPESTKQARKIVIPQDLPTAIPSETPVIVSPTPEAINNTSELIFHTVQQGETLSEIAYVYNIPIADLVGANHIVNENYIQAGQVLLISSVPITVPTPFQNGKQIITILSKQTVYAYENGQLIKSFLISSGLASFPTVTGNYTIERKYPTDDMSGPGYYIEDVPWVMYFHRGYSFHGTTWHNNFGTPMSHGCLNMTVDDASWLYEWSPIGTLVQVIP